SIPRNVPDTLLRIRLQSPGVLRRRTTVSSLTLPLCRRASIRRRSFLTAAAGLAVARAADAAEPGDPPAAATDFPGRARPQRPTPALLLDLAAFEANLGTLAEYCRKAGCGFRPHAKTHKCPEIARRQVASGARGVCVATVPEAEAMVRAGIGGVLLTSPILEP